MIQNDLFGHIPSAGQGSTIPTLTMWQPFASLLIAGIKEHETRSWSIPARLYGRRIAIHAAAALPAERHIPPALAALCDETFGSEWRRTLPFGAILGTCVLAGHVPTRLLRDDVTPADLASGIWDDGRWAWTVTSIDRYENPIPARGAQGIWNWRVADEAETGSNGRK